MQNLVSVIVPFFNREKYLKECVDSIAAQTYKNLEIILVDDGSTDGSAIIVNSMAKNDSRIKLITQANSGVQRARYAGYNSCNGEYIMFVDSDDYIDKNMVENLLKTAVDNNVDMVSSGLNLYYENSGQILRRKKSPDHFGKFEKDEILSILKSKFLLDDDGDSWLPLTMHGKLYKKEPLKHAFDNSLDIRFCEDHVALIDIFYHLNSLFVLDEFYYYYRKHSEQTILRNSDKIWDSRVGALLNIKSADKNGYFKEQFNHKCYIYLRDLVKRNLKKEKLSISLVKERLNSWIEQLPNTFDFDTSQMSIKQKYRYFLLKNKLLWLCKYT